MTIHREGYSTIAIGTVAFIILNWLSFTFISSRVPWLAWVIFILTLGVVLFLISFFRVPVRQLARNPLQVICPADGKVVVIEEIEDFEYYMDKRLQVSIFMSPANVHLNRNPIGGEVRYSQYHQGKYLVAWHPKSSTENERHSVVLANNQTSILVKQIAGAMARRIVNYLQVGQKVEQGAEMGFIKFGSRVDVLLPLGTHVDVRLGEMVKGGVTVLATLA